MKQVSTYAAIAALRAFGQHSVPSDEISKVASAIQDSYKDNLEEFLEDVDLRDLFDHIENRCSAFIGAAIEILDEGHDDSVCMSRKGNAILIYGLTMLLYRMGDMEIIPAYMHQVAQEAARAMCLDDEKDFPLDEQEELPPAFS